MNAGENSNMNMNLIMPGRRSLEDSMCWPCIFMRLAAKPKAESQVEKLAKKVTLIFTAFAFNDLQNREIISTSELITILETT